MRRHPGCRNAARLIAKIVSNENDTKKFLLNNFKPRQVASQRFSVATDVIASLRLIHLTAQNDVSQER
jgi:hypothetical protein